MSLVFRTMPSVTALNVIFCNAAQAQPSTEGMKLVVRKNEHVATQAWWSIHVGWQDAIPDSFGRHSLIEGSIVAWAEMPELDSRELHLLGVI